MTHRVAEAQLARKYGADAWKTMPNWAKVRYRLSEQAWRRHNQRMLIVASVAPAIVVSVVATVISRLL